MTAKEYLQQVFYLNKKINRMIREKEALRDILYSTGGVPDDERVQGGSIGNRTENLIAKIDEKERKINKEIDKLIKMKTEITESLYKLDNEKYVDVLMKRYIDFQSWSEISEKMGCTVRHVLRLHGKALLAFQKMSLECHFLM